MGLKHSKDAAQSCRISQILKPLMTLSQTFARISTLCLLLLLSFPLHTAQAANAWTAFNGMTFGCNGRIHAIAPGPDGRIALGGTFSQCGKVLANNVVIYDPESNEWTPLGDGIITIPGGATQVLDLEWFQGELYVGGEFSRAGNIEAHDLARWDGNQWHSLGLSGQLSSVNALVADNTYLYAGGTFGLGGIKRWDGSTLTSVGGELGTVNALALRDQDLFAAGSFSSAGGVEARNIARWDGTSWHSLESGTTNGTIGTVRAIAVQGNDVYIGGDFTLLVGGVSAKRLARWDGTAWHGLEEEGVNGANGQVRRLTIYQGALLVGGFFTKAGPLDARGLATWDGSRWAPIPQAPGGVSAMAVAGDDIYAGGDFREVANMVVENVARFSNGAWSGVGNGPGRGPNSNVLAMAKSGDALHLAGAFNLADGRSARGLATLRGSDFQPFADIGTYGRIYALAASADDLYVAGNFTAMGSVGATNIARWDGVQWQPLASGIGTGIDAVYALAVWQGQLYAAGKFGSAGGEPAINIARWDGSQWHAMSVGNPLMESAVYALEATEQFLYVGGNFESADGTPVNNIARWDGMTWNALASGVDAKVSTILSSGSDLYVGGEFAKADGLDSPGIARWGGAAWHAVGTGLGLGSNVSALAQGNGVIYVGGRFSTADGLAVNNMAQWDGTHWYSVGHGFENGLSGSVSSLAVYANSLHAGGNIGQVGGKLTTGYAQWKISAPLLFAASFESN